MMSQRQIDFFNIMFLVSRNGYQACGHGDRTQCKRNQDPSGDPSPWPEMALFYMDLDSESASLPAELVVVQAAGKRKNSIG